jgi:spore coat polysaccharide biosynthesis protein SpsF (cytidylyltransferase family)/aryl-alcohol dehydrogenase-like predicted oxidoreductase
MSILLILQARTSSRRLPGKALLPIAGYPSAILAAIRAANRQHRTVLATSDDRSDDLLTAQARKFGIDVFRGPLDDVLARYFFAAATLSDDSIVVRLTGDNVVPDGALVTELIAAFKTSGAEYLDTAPVLSRLPYGVGGEVFTVAALRNAHTAAVSRQDREHVCLWMQRNCRSTVFTPKLSVAEDFSQLRGTIDNQDDYRRVVRLFENVSNPREVGWHELTRRLAALASQPRSPAPEREIPHALHSQLVLGTAQLGMNYGRVNRTGKPNKQSAVEMLRYAINQGVTALDTARGYGDAEFLIGEALTENLRSRTRVITKLDLSEVADEASDLEVRNSVDASIDASRCALRSVRLDTLLLHDWAHHDRWCGIVWQRLREHQVQGTVSNLGASVYYPHEAIAALGDPEIQHLQIPMNVLDWRWKQVGKALGQRPDVVVHARSALLQGILAHQADRWPPVGDFNNVRCAEILQALTKRFDRDSVPDLCLSYVRSLPWICSIVVGCETLDQLQENLRLFSRPPLSSEEVCELEQTLPKPPEELLNPAKWESLEQKAAYAN